MIYGLLIDVSLRNDCIVTKLSLEYVCICTIDDNNITSPMF